MLVQVKIALWQGKNTIRVTEVSWVVFCGW